MSTNPTDATKRSHPSVFSRSRTQAASRYLNSEVIATDIAAFKKRGGHIEVLGNTAGRSRLASTTFRSNVKSKRQTATAAATGLEATGATTSKDGSAH